MLYFDGTFQKKDLSDFDKGQIVRTKKTRPEHLCVGATGECTYSVVGSTLSTREENLLAADRALNGQDSALEAA